MSTERYEIAIPFYLRGPADISTSDFNTLILRLQELRDSIASTYHSEIEIEQNNRNIEAIQSLLDNFKIKVIEENNEKPNTL